MFTKGPQHEVQKSDFLYVLRGLGPKVPQGGPKDPPRALKVSPKVPKGAPGWSQGPPRALKVRPKGVPGWSQGPPQGAKSEPKAQRCPGWSQGPPQGAKSEPKGLNKESKNYQKLQNRKHVLNGLPLYDYELVPIIANKPREFMCWFSSLQTNPGNCRN